jgi:hypothetical protein
MVAAAGRASARTWCLPGTAQKGYWRKRHIADLSNAVHTVRNGVERPWLMKLLGDTDPDGTRLNLLKMVSVTQRIPEMIVVPSHDRRAYAEMARLPNVTTKGLLL